MQVFGDAVAFKSSYSDRFPAFLWKASMFQLQKVITLLLAWFWFFFSFLYLTQFCVYYNKFLRKNSNSNSIWSHGNNFGENGFVNLILILLCVSLLIELEHSCSVHIIGIWNVLYHISVSSKFSGSSSRHPRVFFFPRFTWMECRDLIYFLFLCHLLLEVVPSYLVYNVQNLPIIMYWWICISIC